MAIKSYKGSGTKSNFRRIALYGEPKIGKTRLATSLPWGQDDWGEAAVYIPQDPGADDMERSPILMGNRKHIIMGEYAPDVDAKGNEVWADPHEQASQLASMDWKALHPEANTLIWDTMTTTAEQLLKYHATLAQFGNNISLGKRGTDSFISIPSLGDYRATAFDVHNLLDHLFKQQMHVIVLFHARLTEPDEGEVVGGPATVGKASLRPIAGRFDNLIRIAARRERIGTGTPPKFETKRVVFTEPTGPWLGGSRNGLLVNPMGEYVLESGKDPVGFWVDLAKLNPKE